MRAILFGIRIGLVTLVVVMVSGSARAQESRTWKDASGKFSIKAKYVGNMNGTLTLAREDGEEVEIELKKLCDADRKYVEDYEKDQSNPFKAAKADPFKAKKSAKPRATATKEARPVNADWSRAQALLITPEQADWKVSVGAVEAAPTFKARAIAVPPKSNFFERTKGMVISADGKHAAIGYSLDEPRPTGMTRLVLVDLEKGKTVGSAASSGVMMPLAINDDGTQVLMKRDENGFGNSDRLEVWSVESSAIVKGVSFYPYEDARGGDRDIKSAAFLDGDRAITVSNKGKLAIWDLGSAKVSSTIDIQNGTIPALSPDRKLLAFTTDKEVGILDLESGSVQALKPTANTPFATLAFSPSGKKFAVACIDKLWCYDTATGTLEVEMLMGGTPPNGEVIWTDEDHILVAHQYLLDLVNQVKLWQYQGVERAGRVGPTTLLLVDNGQQSPGAIVPAQLPHPAVKASLDKALADPTFFVLKPGAPVRINVDALADPSRKAAITAALTEKLTAIGARALPTAPLELVASTEAGKQRDITYRTMGRGFGSKTYKVQEYISRVKFVYQGKTAWETSTMNIPMFISLRDGQTMEAYLKEQEKPNYDFFTRVELPKLLTRPTGTTTLGSSRVTSAGVR